MKNAILSSNTILKTNCPITEIFDDHIVTSKGDKFYYGHLICTIPQLSLQKFDYFKDNELIQSVKPIPLLRIYVKYPTENLWFKNIRDKNPNFISLCLNSKLSSEISIQPAQRYDLDGVIIFSDILLVNYAFGQSVVFKKSVGPILKDFKIDKFY